MLTSSNFKLPAKETLYSLSAFLFYDVFFMALTNQPYLPLYINDWLSSTKLKSCSILSHGLMINIMALMHKEDSYGTILLRQKYQQSSKQILNFAKQLAKVLPFESSDIEIGLDELIEEGCLIISEDLLICKRMVKDAEISMKRANSGSKGGEKTSILNKNFATAKVQAKVVAKHIAKPESIIINENIIESEIPLFDELKKISLATQAFNNYLEMRKKNKKQPTEKAIKLIKKKVWELAKGNEETVINILNQSIINNWTDVYPLKDISNQTSNVRTTTPEPSNKPFGKL